MDLRGVVPEPARAPLRRVRDAYRNSVVYRLRHAPSSRRLVRKTLARPPIKLHLGSGPKALPGWLNIDVRHYPGVAVMSLPAGLHAFPDSSVQFVYCSHMLEHVGYPAPALELCGQIHRLLAPGGAARFVVPGIERIIRAYVADDAEFFDEQRRHHPAWCTTKLEHLMYALQQDGQHKYGYDFETASKLLRRAGFSRVIDSAYNASEFAELRVDYHGEHLSLFFDAAK
jgi:predicted SAM-dependent methyltransferase